VDSVSEMDAMDEGLAMGLALADAVLSGLVVVFVEDEVLFLEFGRPIARSNGFPGVLGVFAEPNAANAPEPRPNAFDADEGPGDARLPPGVLMDSKGFVLPWEEESPNLLEKEALRLVVALSPPAVVPLEPLLLVVRESLVELDRAAQLAGAEEKDVWGQSEEGAGRRRTDGAYLVRRVHRLSMKVIAPAHEGETSWCRHELP
jgi:hypothetical protein